MHVWCHLSAHFTTVNTYLAGIVFGTTGGKRQKWQKYETAKYSFEFSYTISNKWTHILSKLASVSSKTYIWTVEFHRRGNHVYYMLPIGSIFFPLKVARMRLVNNFEGHSVEKWPKLNYANISVFTNCQISMPRILSDLQYYPLAVLCTSRPQEMHLRNELDFRNVHGIINTSGLLQSKWSPSSVFMLTLQETRSIHDSMNILKIEFITYICIYFEYLIYINYL